MTTGSGHEWRPRARKVVLWSALAGLAIVLTGAAVAWSWRDELPAEIASHWSGGGAPDDTMAVGTFVVVNLVMALVLMGVFVPIGLVWGHTAATRRTAAGAMVWSGSFAAALLLTTFGMQRGVEDVSTVAMPGWVLAVVLLGPVVPAVVVAALVPGDPPMPAEGPVPDDAPRAALGPDEDAEWSRRIAGGPGVAVGAVAVVATAVLAVATGLWAMLFLPVLLAALFAAMFAFTVQVDTSGLTVRSLLGWPRTHIPAGEVLRASVITVNPLGDFGGWGWRAGIDGGRVGVVLRTGEALLVERTGERGFVVTVDDAEAAAALLNTMADRSRTGPARS